LLLSLRNSLSLTRLPELQSNPELRLLRVLHLRLLRQYRLGLSLPLRHHQLCCCLLVCRLGLSLLLRHQQLCCCLLVCRLGCGLLLRLRLRLALLRQHRLRLLRWLRLLRCLRWLRWLRCLRLQRLLRYLRYLRLLRCLRCLRCLRLLHQPPLLRGWLAGRHLWPLPRRGGVLPERRARVGALRLLHRLQVRHHLQHRHRLRWLAGGGEGDELRLLQRRERHGHRRDAGEAARAGAERRVLAADRHARVLPLQRQGDGALPRLTLLAERRAALPPDAGYARDVAGDAIGAPAAAEHHAADALLAAGDARRSAPLPLAAGSVLVEGIHRDRLHEVFDQHTRRRSRLRPHR